MKVRTKIFLVFILMGVFSVSLDVGSSLFDYSRGFPERNPTTISQFHSYGILLTFIFGYAEFLIITIAMVIIYNILENRKFMSNKVKNVLFLMIIILIIVLFIGHLITGIENLWYNGV